MNFEGFDELTEKLTTYDSVHYQFSYKVLSEDLPPFYLDGENTWLHKTGENRTKITMITKMELGGLMGFIAQGQIEFFTMERIIDVLKELKYYVETRLPNRRKLRTLELSK